MNAWRSERGRHAQPLLYGAGVKHANRSNPRWSSCDQTPHAVIATADAATMPAETLRNMRV